MSANLSSQLIKTTNDNLSTEINNRTTLYIEQVKAKAAQEITDVTNNFVHNIKLDTLKRIDCFINSILLKYDKIDHAFLEELKCAFFDLENDIDFGAQNMKLNELSPTQYIPKNIQIENVKKIKTSETDSVSSSKVSKPKSKSSNCVYVFTKGKSKGETCGIICIDNYCNKHKKYDISIHLDSDTEVATVPLTVKNVQKIVKQTKSKVVEEQPLINLQITMNDKIGHKMEKNTKLVFNDKNIVIGKYLKTKVGSITKDIIKELGLKDIEEAKKYEFEFENPIDNDDVVEYIDSLITLINSNYTKSISIDEFKSFIGKTIMELYDESNLYTYYSLIKLDTINEKIIDSLLKNKLINKKPMKSTVTISKKKNLNLLKSSSSEDEEISNLTSSMKKVENTEIELDDDFE